MQGFEAGKVIGKVKSAELSGSILQLIFVGDFNDCIYRRRRNYLNQEIFSGIQHLFLNLVSKGHKKFLGTDKEYYDGIFLYSGTRGEVPQVSGILERRNEAPLEHHEMNSNKDPCLNPKISIGIVIGRRKCERATGCSHLARIRFH
jgi:hypothetical protein